MMQAPLISPTCAHWVSVEISHFRHIVPYLEYSGSFRDIQGLFQNILGLFKVFLVFRGGSISPHYSLPGLLVVLIFTWSWDL